MYILISTYHEALWELLGFGFHRNLEVKRVRAREIPGWVTHWEVLVNKTMRAWSGPKANNIMLRRSRARNVVDGPGSSSRNKTVRVESSPGSGGGPGGDVTVSL
ncbi:hypothetical protein DVH24_008060 [Malus domestica]|uniref:Uncharacterized protein n=1 Tax=Malus domestica TaxID=3750 RepID=A0A498JJ42_MALDO|nr:hypothetical protein DVH24_008060 [Malus domestica]